MNKIRIDIRRIPLFIGTVLVLLVGFASVTGMGTGPVNTFTVQTINGIIFKITGAFTVTGLSFFPISDTTPATTQPCGWPASCSTSLTAGDWRFGVGLTLNTVPGALTTYTISLCCFVVGQSPFQNLQFQVPITATANSEASFYFETGTTNLPSTTVILIQVQ